MRGNASIAAPLSTALFPIIAGRVCLPGNPRLLPRTKEEFYPVIELTLIDGPSQERWRRMLSAISPEMDSAATTAARRDLPISDTGGEHKIDRQFFLDGIGTGLVLLDPPLLSR